MKIIFRVTDKVFGIHAQHRYFSDNKTEVAIRCFNSLLNSIGNRRDECQIVAVADKCSQQLLDALQASDQIIERNYSGLKESIIDSFAIASQNPKEWTFFVEDDYLVWDGAFDRLLSDINGAFERGFGFRDYPGIAFHPSDYSDRYTRECDVRKKGHIMRSGDTYYRQIYNTTMTVLMNQYALNQALKEIVPLMQKYNSGQGFDAIFSDLYSRPDILCVSPIPSFAFHLDNHNTPPPAINWRAILENSANV
jgi:hypothetical protein